jgi:2'-5' RNA ligase
MRLFIATPVNFPLYKALKDDFSKAIDGKWVEGWNLHLTHKFIGEGDIKEFQKPLSIPKENIKVKGVGRFGERILFLKASLKEINSLINKTFNLKDDRDFVGHITLCRIKNIKDKELFEKLIKKWENVEFEVPYEVYLYKSTLTKKGPIYEKIYKY